MLWFICCMLYGTVGFKKGWGFRVGQFSSQELFTFGSRGEWLGRSEIWHVRRIRHEGDLPYWLWRWRRPCGRDHEWPPGAESNPWLIASKEMGTAVRQPQEMEFCQRSVEKRTSDSSWECSQLTPWLCPRETPEENPVVLCLGFWSTTLRDKKWVSFQVAQFVVICYGAVDSCVCFLRLTEAITPNLVTLSNSNLFSRGSRGQQPETKVSAGLHFHEGSMKESSLFSSSLWWLWVFFDFWSLPHLEVVLGTSSPLVSVSSVSFPLPVS